MYLLFVSEYTAERELQTAVDLLDVVSYLLYKTQDTDYNGAHLGHYVVKNTS